MAPRAKLILVDPTHRDAIDLLARIISAESLVEDFSLCQSHKSEFNYHASDLAIEHAGEVLDAARRLATVAVQRVVVKGWFPSTLNPRDYDF